MLPGKHQPKWFPSQPLDHDAFVDHFPSAEDDMDFATKQRFQLSPPVHPFQSHFNIGIFGPKHSEHRREDPIEHALGETNYQTAGLAPMGAPSGRDPFFSIRQGAPGPIEQDHSCLRQFNSSIRSVK
jgi:hypothetical protein